MSPARSSEVCRRPPTWCWGAGRQRRATHRRRDQDPRRILGRPLLLVPIGEPRAARAESVAGTRHGQRAERAPASEPSRSIDDRNRPDALHRWVEQFPCSDQVVIKHSVILKAWLARDTDPERVIEALDHHLAVPVSDSMRRCGAGSAPERSESARTRGCARRWRCSTTRSARSTASCPTSRNCATRSRWALPRIRFGVCTGARASCASVQRLLSGARVTANQPWSKTNNPQQTPRTKYCVRFRRLA